MNAAASATVVIRNADVYTGKGYDAWATAIAVRGSKIVAVGSDDDVKAASGPATQIVDLEGATVMPGFIDAHVHPGMGGGMLLQCDLSNASTAAEYLTVIRSYAAGLAADAWVTGGGWSMAAFDRGVPDARTLDLVTGGRPAFLVNRDTHSAWVNTAALRAAGIDSSTPDPAGGRIERDVDHHPSGALHESAMALVRQHVPPTGDARPRDALLAGVRYLNQLGITGWQDAKILGEDVDAYVELEGSGLLTARVVGAFWLDPNRGAEQVDEIIDRRAALTSDLFTLGSVKVMLDGVCETFTASLSAPYFDADGQPTRNSGIDFFDEKMLRECAQRLDAAGFQLHFHAVGDAAVTKALDTVEHVRAVNGPSRNRPHVAHVQVVRPVDVLRFRALGVAVNAQPLWARLEAQMTELTLPFLGATRAAWQYPFGDFENAGTMLAFGSDWPVSTPDPIKIMHVAVNRTPVPERTSWRPQDGVFRPDQRLSLPTSVRAYTQGSAWVNRMEHICGCIEVGKSADFAVLDSNPFDRPRNEIWQTHATQTWFRGAPLK